MARNQQKHTRPWSRRRRLWRRLALIAAAAAAVAVIGLIGVYLGGREGAPESGQQVTGAAPEFTLPTIAGDEFSSRDHLGQHALLLYFNEGMG